MKDKIKEGLKKLKEDMQDVKLLAIVTKTRSEVVFYSTVDGVMQQSNAMAEEDLIDPYELDLFYRDVTDLIRGSDKFQEERVNILKYDEKTGISMEYGDGSKTNHVIRKNWKKSIGV